MARGNIRNGLRGVRRVERVGEQHRILDRTPKLNSLRIQSMHRGLHIMNALEYRRVFQDTPQFRSDGKRKPDASFRRHGNHGTILLLGSFGYVEKAEGLGLFELLVLLRGRRRGIKRKGKPIASSLVKRRDLLGVRLFDELELDPFRSGREFLE